MKIKERSVGMSILFSILTCGLYSWYWFYAIIDDIYNITEDKRNPALEIVLCVFTCNFYTVYLWNKLGKSLETIRKVENLPSKNCSVTFTILAVLGYFAGGLSAIVNLGTLIPNEEIATFFSVLYLIALFVSFFCGIFIFILLSITQSYLNEMSGIEFSRSYDTNQF